jgi:hypothetical protein
LAALRIAKDFCEQAGAAAAWLHGTQLRRADYNRIGLPRSAEPIFGG